MGVRFRVVCGRVRCLDAWVEIFQLPGLGLGSNFAQVVGFQDFRVRLTRNLTSLVACQGMDWQI